MSEAERLLSDFHGITISGAHVDSVLPAGVTLSFALSPTPLPIQWRLMFTNLSNNTRGSVMSSSSPLLHGNNVVWQVIEGDIPNARHLVEARVASANALFEQMLADEAQLRVLRDHGSPRSPRSTGSSRF